MAIKSCILGPIPKGFFTLRDDLKYKIVGEKIGQNFNSNSLSLEIAAF